LKSLNAGEILLLADVSQHEGVEHWEGGLKGVAVLNLLPRSTVVVGCSDGFSYDSVMALLKREVPAFCMIMSLIKAWNRSQSCMQSTGNQKDVPLIGEMSINRFRQF
jgi:hypothetical protein